MNLQVLGAKIRKPKTTHEKDEYSDSGVTKVTTITIEATDLSEDDIEALGRYAAYSHPVNISVTSPQGDLVSFASGEANG